MHKIFSSICFAVLMWSLLVWRAGYRFGTGDHVEYLPYVLYLQNHSLYIHDFFVQGLAEKVPNERTIVAGFFTLFGSHLEIACLIVHFVFTVLLITGLQKLGELITGNIAIARVAIVINLLLFFNHALGDVELYSDAVQASSISTAVIAFALYHFFKRNFLWATVLMSIASIIHPVEGLTVFMVMASAMMVYCFKLGICEKEVLIKSFAFYASTAGIFIALLVWGKMDGVTVLSKQFDSYSFYRIYYVFRHAHHFVFTYQSLADILLFIAFITASLAFGFSSNRAFFWFSLFSVLGLLCYVIATDYLHLVDIANLQFYKVTQWTKFFGVLIFSKFILRFLQPWSKPVFSPKMSNVLALAAAISLLAVICIKPHMVGLRKADYQLGRNWKENDDAIAIAIMVDKQVGKDAVFIQPFSCTELKFFGRASSYVDWKAFVKNRTRIGEWYRRIGLVYGISIDDKEKGFGLTQKAEANFFNLKKETAARLKNEGVTHILTSNKQMAFGKLLFQNRTYAVYQL
jgi:hypothetical protein